MGKLYLCAATLASMAIAQACPERVSVASAGLEANSHSYAPSVSTDGAYIAFVSDASNLVPGDNNLVADVFVRDRRLDVTTRVSVASNGAQMDPWLSGGFTPLGCSTPSISGDGRFVAFASYGSNLVPGDTNARQDIFVHDRSTGSTVRVSVSTNGIEADADSYFPTISRDGLIVAWQSSATNLVLGDTNGNSDIFVHDRTTATTTRVSLTAASAQVFGSSTSPSLSTTGQFVAFASTASNLVAGDTNAAADVFVADRVTGSVTRISVNSSGAQAIGSSLGSGEPSISGDGTKIAFRSYMTNLIAGDTNGCADIFLRDLAAGTTTRTSLTATSGQGVGNSASGATGSFGPRISQDGRYVAFVSHSTNLVPNDSNATADTFLRDTLVATTTRMGVTPKSASLDTGAAYWGSTPWLAISGDGATVAFITTSSSAVDVDTNGATDVFVNSLRPRLATAATIAKGQTLTLTMDAPSNAVGSAYVLAAALATTPGIHVGAGRVFPLANDAVLIATLSPSTPGLMAFHGSFGVTASATATFAVPNTTSLVGLTLSSAFVILDGGHAYGLRACSNVVTFVITN